MNSFWKDRKVLVTGGAGFVGSHLAEMLVELGSQVTVADNLSNGRLGNLVKVSNKIKFHNLNLNLLPDCQTACEGQEIVFNLAAKVANIGYNRGHHIEIFEDNILLQMLPLKAASETGAKKFLQVSTVCVYPDDAVVPTPEDEGDKGAPEATNEGYGWAKKMGERLAKFYADRNEIEAIVARFSNVYGERDHFDEKAHVIPAFIKKCLAAKAITAWGSGNQTRSFLYVKDAAAGLIKLMECYNRPDPVNIGGAEMITMKDLLNKIIRILGTKNKVVWDTSYPDGHLKRQSDIAKLKSITGWAPDTPLHRGLERTINWYLSEIEK